MLGSLEFIPQLLPGVMWLATAIFDPVINDSNLISMYTWILCNDFPGLGLGILVDPAQAFFQ
jgi:hypothetical protein